MTTRRRGGRRGRSRAPRRASEWFDTQINLTLSSASQTFQDLLLNVSDNLRKGMTIVRVIMDLYGVLSVAGSGGLIHLGLTIVNDDAISALAFPDVDNADEQPGWMWRAAAVIATSDPNDSSQMVRFIRDLRSMRRLPGEDVSLMLIADSGTLTAPVNIDGLIRTLVLKP